MEGVGARIFTMIHDTTKHPCPVAGCGLRELTLQEEAS